MEDKLQRYSHPPQDPLCSECSKRVGLHTVTLQDRPTPPLPKRPWYQICYHLVYHLTIFGDIYEISVGGIVEGTTQSNDGLRLISMYHAAFYLGSQGYTKSVS